MYTCTHRVIRKTDRTCEAQAHAPLLSSASLFVFCANVKWFHHAFRLALVGACGCGSKAAAVISVRGAGVPVGARVGGEGCCRLPTGDRSSTGMVFARTRGLRSRFFPRLLLLRRCTNGGRCFHMHLGVGRARELLCWRPPPQSFGLIYRRQDTAPAGEETPHRVTAGAQWAEGLREDVKMDGKSVFDARTKRKSYTRRRKEKRADRRVERVGRSLRANALKQTPPPPASDPRRPRLILITHGSLCPNHDGHHDRV